MSSIFVHQIRENIICTSTRCYSVHKNILEQASKSVLRYGAAELDEVLHTQQNSDICERHRAFYVAYQLESLCYINRVKATQPGKTKSQEMKRTEVVTFEILRWP